MVLFLRGKQKVISTTHTHGLCVCVRAYFSIRPSGWGEFIASEPESAVTTSLRCSKKNILGSLFIAASSRGRIPIAFRSPGQRRRRRAWRRRPRHFKKRRRSEEISGSVPLLSVVKWFPAGCHLLPPCVGFVDEEQREEEALGLGVSRLFRSESDPSFGPVRPYAPHPVDGH